jgi:hypothetical protein
MPSSPAEEVERYIRTGRHEDEFYRAWPGQDFFARAEAGRRALREALVAEVHRRTPHATVPERLADLDVVAFTRAKVAPMVRGLFPRAEQQAVLEVLSHGIVFLSPANVEAILRQARWHKTAWDLANLYLASLDAELLADDAPAIVGLSEETTCFVSAEYFSGQSRFADFVVHEAAHVFHNCKRRTIGLREGRHREWLLDIDFSRRETFAYACEAYSRLLELGDRVQTRRDVLAELLTEPGPVQDKVDPGEYVAILREAVEARNGWKRILARCAPRPIPPPVAVTPTLPL